MTDLKTQTEPAMPPCFNYKAQYADRIDQLREAAHEEGFKLNECSAKWFFLFLNAAPYRVRRTGIALAAKGEINAIWVTEDRKSRFSIDICENGDVDYAFIWADDPIESNRLSIKQFWAGLGEKLRPFLVEHPSDTIFG